MHGKTRSRQKSSEAADQSRFRPEPFVQRQQARRETVDPASRLERAQRLGKNLVQMAAAPGTAVAQRNEDPPKNETGMPDRLKGGLEQLSGLDLSGVRVHRNSDKPAQVGALAYTRGQDIHVAPGQESTLPHEAWHSVQQMQGRVRPTGQVAGLPLNDDAGLEREADVMGKKALQ